MMMENKRIKKLYAIDLLIEDLNTVRSDIRNQAKELECEPELDVLKNDLLNYLHGHRKNVYHEKVI